MAEQRLTDIHEICVGNATEIPGGVVRGRIDFRDSRCGVLYRTIRIEQGTKHALHFLFDSLPPWLLTARRYLNSRLTLARYPSAAKNERFQLKRIIRSEEREATRCFRSSFSQRSFAEYVRSAVLLRDPRREWECNVDECRVGTGIRAKSRGPGALCESVRRDAQLAISAR